MIYHIFERICIVNEIFKTIKLSINNIFNFTVCIPPFKLSTSKARAVLPKDPYLLQPDTKGPKNVYQK